MLTEKRITLLDPETWDDKNDSHFLRLYRETNQLQSVLALCFSQHGETYHHWRVFASGASGICITLSPWLHPVYKEHVKNTLWKIEGCEDLKISQSTLISNEDWKTFGDSAVNGPATTPKRKRRKRRRRNKKFQAGSA